MFEVCSLNYEERKGELDAEAKSAVKSTKFFPIYDMEGGKYIKYIFKPLSKTKPFTSGLFAVAEVFWSNIINHYFMEAPLYKLAICHGYSESVPKYYDYGSLVPDIRNDGETMVNVYEYFEKYPDQKVSISNYTNYCMMSYDWTAILQSDIMQQRTDIAESLAKHILVSILKADQNYHYENVAFMCKDGNITKIVPMIDHEFSTFFLYPDVPEMQNMYVTMYKVSMFKSDTAVGKNIEYICENYPNVAAEFAKELSVMISDLTKPCKNNYIKEIMESGFLFDCSNRNYMVGQARYKEHDEEKAMLLEATIRQVNISENFPVMYKTIIKQLTKHSDALYNIIAISLED